MPNKRKQWHGEMIWMSLCACYMECVVSVSQCCCCCFFVSPFVASLCHDFYRSYLPMPMVAIVLFRSDKYRVTNTFDPKIVNAHRFRMSLNVCIEKHWLSHCMCRSLKVSSFNLKQHHHNQSFVTYYCYRQYFSTVFFSISCFFFPLSFCNDYFLYFSVCAI